MDCIVGSDQVTDTNPLMAGAMFIALESVDDIDNNG